MWNTSKKSVWCRFWIGPLTWMMEIPTNKNLFEDVFVPPKAAKSAFHTLRSSFNKLTCFSHADRRMPVILLQQQFGLGNSPYLPDTFMSSHFVHIPHWILLIPGPHLWLLLLKKRYDNERSSVNHRSWTWNFPYKPAAQQTLHDRPLLYVGLQLHL